MREPALPGAGALAALAASALLLAGTAGPASPVPGPPAPAAAGIHAPSAAVAADTLQTTVYRVDARAGTVDVLRGVGLAFHVERIHTVEETTVYVGESPSNLAAVRPGQRVWIEFWDREEGYGEGVPGRVAREIHVLPEADGEEET